MLSFILKNPQKNRQINQQCINNAYQASNMLGNGMSMLLGPALVHYSPTVNNSTGNNNTTSGMNNMNNPASPHPTQHNLTSPRPPPLVFKLLEQQRREGGGEGKYRPLHGDSRRNLRSTYHRQSTIVFKNQFSNLLPGETL